MNVLRPSTQVSGMTDTLQQQLHTIQHERKIQRQQRLRRSRLDRYRSEIEQLRTLGASYEDITVWLQQIKHININRSSVYRMLQRWQQRDAEQQQRRDQLHAHYDQLPD